MGALGVECTCGLGNPSPVNSRHDAGCPCAGDALIPPRRKSPTNQRRTEPITHFRAQEAAIRLIHSHFGQEPHARITIPLNLDDDDVVIMDYIEQQMMKEIGP